MCCETTTNGRCGCAPHMCCWYAPRHRFFFGKEEEIEMLEKYGKELEKEIQGVKEKIGELRG